MLSLEEPDFEEDVQVSSKRRRALMGEFLLPFGTMGTLKGMYALLRGISGLTLVMLKSVAGL